MHLDLNAMFKDTVGCGGPILHVVRRLLRESCGPESCLENGITKYVIYSKISVAVISYEVDVVILSSKYDKG